MLNPNKISTMLDVDFIPVRDAELIASFTVQTGTPAANSLIGLDADAASANVVGETGIAADRQLITSEPVKMHGIGSGNPFLDLVNGYVGCQMNTAGNAIQWLLRLPSYWDIRQRLRWRGVWTTNSTTAADTVDWKLTYRVLIPETTAISAGIITALDTVIAQDNVLGTSDVIHRTPWGILNAGTIGNTVEYLSVQMEMDAKAAGLTENIWLLGLEVEHTIRRGRGLQKAARRFARSQD
jgi:hypothetical protein